MADFSDFFAKRRSARHLPADDGDCGWLEILPAPPPATVLEGDERADAVVIGAGFTGLAAARRLAELRPDDRIVVVDAQRAGEGASGRSSGFVVDLAGFILEKPKDDAERFIRLSRAGIDDLRRLVEAHDIDCDWDATGFLHVAAGDIGMRGLTSLRSRLEARGEPFEWHDAEGMTRITGSRFYRAGIRLPGSVLVQGGALVRGLAASLPENVDLFEGSPVRTIARDVGDGSPGGYRLDAGNGSLRTPRLVLATNAYAPNLGFLRRRVFPLLTFGSFTRVLTDAEQTALGGEREWGVLAQDPVGSSVRRTRDQRLLIRNFIHYDRRARAPESAYREALELHRQALARRFPELADLELERTWGGAMGISPNFSSFFGHLDEQIVAAGGFTAAGIAMGTISGRLLADLLLGEPTDALLRDRLALPGPRWLPPDPFLSLGIRHRVARMNASGGDTL